MSSPFLYTHSFMVTLQHPTPIPSLLRDLWPSGSCSWVGIRNFLSCCWAHFPVHNAILVVVQSAGAKHWESSSFTLDRVGLPGESEEVVISANIRWCNVRQYTFALTTKPWGHWQASGFWDSNLLKPHIDNFSTYTSHFLCLNLNWLHMYLFLWEWLKAVAYVIRPLQKKKEKCPIDKQVLTLISKTAQEEAMYEDLPQSEGSVYIKSWRC